MKPSFVKQGLKALRARTLEVPFDMLGMTSNGSNGGSHRREPRSIAKEARPWWRSRAKAYPVPRHSVPMLRDRGM